MSAPADSKQTEAPAAAPAAAAAAAPASAPTDDVEKRLREQVEFYFSNSNLPRDRFLLGKVRESKEGWVDVSLLASFARMRSISTDASLISKALRTSTSVVVSEDGKKVRRTEALPADYDPMPKSVRVRGLPQTVTIESIRAMFESQAGDIGRVVCVRIFRDKERKPNGCALVEFDSEPTAQAIATRGRSSAFKYDGSIVKITMGKKRKAPGDAAKQEVKQEPLVSDRLVKFECKNAEGGVCTWQDIKDRVNTISDVAFVEYEQGAGYVRLKNAASVGAKACVEALGEAQIGGVTLTFSALEGDAEAKVWAEVCSSRKSKSGNNGPRRKRQRR